MSGKLKTLEYVDSMDFGRLGCQGEFYAYHLRELAKKWIEELVNLKDDGMMFSICGETTVKKPHERRVLINFITVFFNLKRTWSWRDGVHEEKH